MERVETHQRLRILSSRNHSHVSANRYEICFKCSIASVWHEKSGVRSIFPSLNGMRGHCISRFVDTSGRITRCGVECEADGPDWPLASIRHGSTAKSALKLVIGEVIQLIISHFCTPRSRVTQFFAHFLCQIGWAYGSVHRIVSFVWPLRKLGALTITINYSWFSFITFLSIKVSNYRELSIIYFGEKVFILSNACSPLALHLVLCSFFLFMIKLSCEREHNAFEQVLKRMRENKAHDKESSNARELYDAVLLEWVCVCACCVSASQSALCNDDACLLCR